MGQVVGVHVRREVIQRHEQQIAHRQRQHHADHRGHDTVADVAALHDGIEQEQQRHRRDGGYPTSSGVWTPRYMREKGTSTAMTMQTMRTHLRRVNWAMPPKVPTAFWVWPLGKE